MIAFRRERHAPRAGASPGAVPVYAIGDVHGRYDLLHALLAEIRRDAAARLADAPPRLILCGDYVDRGPDSAKVLSALAWLRRSSAVDLTLLDGNHEAMLRGFLDDPVAHAAWLRFGGAATLRSYGVDVPADETPATLVAARDRLLDAMPAAHDRLLHALEAMAQAGDYVFVHAGVRPGVALADQVRDDLLWIRGDFLDHPRPAAAAVVVHGHTWSDDRAIVLPHRIAIDTGAYDTGVLSAVRIDADAVEVIQAVALNPP